MLKLPSQKPERKLEFPTRIVAVLLSALKIDESSVWKIEVILKNFPDTLWLELEIHSLNIPLLSQISKSS